MTDFKSQKIKQVIKTLLKKKGITYESLATSLECSVPTVKRILGPEELSLTRLLQMCEVVEIDLRDLEELTQDTSVQDSEFTDDQQHFLAKNPAYLSYLLRLFNGESPKQIADRYGLTQRSTDKYLIGLEKKELIHVTGKQKVKPAFKEIPRLGDGPLGKLYFESFIGSAAKFFIEIIKESMRLKQAGTIKKEDIPKSRFAVHTCKITKGSYDHWVEEQEKARRAFDRLVDFEQKTKDPSELMTAVIVRSHTLVKNDHPTLEILEDITGKITNL